MNMRLSTIAYLCALLLLCSAVGAVENQSITLAENGKPFVSIVVTEDVAVQTRNEVYDHPVGYAAHMSAAAKDASIFADYARTQVRSAVDDLARCMEKASGARVSIVEEGTSVSGPAVYVGGTKFAKKAGLALDTLSFDGYVIARRGDSVIIVGRTDDGTVNGVYGFLRDYMGVRWFMPGELWEVIPENDPLVVKVPDTVRYEPDFACRNWASAFDARWLARNRLSVERDGIPYYCLNHYLKRLFPVSRYGKDHPEYYAEIDGKRFVPENDNSEQSQPCFTNPEVIRVAAENVRKFFSEHPEVPMCSLTMNDNIEFCTCPNCKALDAPYRSHRGICVHSNSYYYFVQEIAKEIAKTHPGKTLGCLAYLSVELPPTNIDRLPDNVAICVTQDTSQQFDAAYRDADRELIRRWSKKTVRLLKFDYYGLGWFLPRYFPTLAASDIKFLRKNSVVGHYNCIYGDWAVQGPMVYMASQLMWDEDQDTNRLLDEFNTTLFGSAGPEMKEFYSILESVWMKPRQGRWLAGAQGQPFAVEGAISDSKAMGRSMSLLDKALGKSSGACHERVTKIKSDFSFSFLISDGYDAAISLGSMTIESKADVDRAAREMVGVLRIARLAEWTYASTLAGDPYYDHAYYSADPSSMFWWKFDGWESVLVKSVKDQLTRMKGYTRRTMQPEDADRYMDGVASRLSAIGLRKPVDLR